VCYHVVLLLADSGVQGAYIVYPVVTDQAGYGHPSPETAHAVNAISEHGVLRSTIEWRCLFMQHKAAWEGLRVFSCLLREGIGGLGLFGFPGVRMSPHNPVLQCRCVTGQSCQQS